MNNGNNVSQTVGTLVFVVAAGLPGMHLAGFMFGSGGPPTLPTLLGCLLLSVVGGAVGGLLLSPDYRIAGMLGGLVAGPLGLLAVYFYARNRQSMHNLEPVLVQGAASLPGLGVYFLVRLLTDALFPPAGRARRDFDDEDDEPRPKRRRRPRDDDDEDDDEPRPKRRRARYDDE